MALDRAWYALNVGNMAIRKVESFACESLITSCNYTYSSSPPFRFLGHVVKDKKPLPTAIKDEELARFRQAAGFRQGRAGHPDVRAAGFRQERAGNPDLQLIACRVVDPQNCACLEVFVLARDPSLARP